MTKDLHQLYGRLIPGHKADDGRVTMCGYETDPIKAMMNLHRKGQGIVLLNAYLTRTYVDKDQQWGPLIPELIFDSIFPGLMKSNKKSREAIKASKSEQT